MAKQLTNTHVRMFTKVNCQIQAVLGFGTVHDKIHGRFALNLSKRERSSSMDSSTRGSSFDRLRANRQRLLFHFVVYSRISVSLEPKTHKKPMDRNS